MEKKTFVFNTLTITERTLLIAEFGRHIMTIMHCGLRAELYVIGTHYVELLVDMRTGSIEFVGTVDAYDLNKYLAHIELPEIA